MWEEHRLIIREASGKPDCIILAVQMEFATGWFTQQVPCGNWGWPLVPTWQGLTTSPYFSTLLCHNGQFLCFSWVKGGKMQPQLPGESDQKELTYVKPLGLLQNHYLHNCHCLHPPAHVAWLLQLFMVFTCFFLALESFTSTLLTFSSTVSR